VPNVFHSSRGPILIFLVKVTVPFYSPKMTFFQPQSLTLENYPSACYQRGGLWPSALIRCLEMGNRRPKGEFIPGETIVKLYY